MTALENITDLQDEYRIALRLWSEARAMYGTGSAEAAEAAKQLEQLEKQLIANKPTSYN